MYNGEIYKVSGILVEGVINNIFVFEFNGLIYIVFKGKLDFVYFFDQGDFFYLLFGLLVVKGDKMVGIDVIDGVVCYGEDNNGDDIYDVGVYFNNLIVFVSGNYIGFVFLDIDVIFVFFVVNQFYYYVYEIVYIIDEVIVEFGYYYDLDIFDLELVILFCWYVNGVVFDDVNGIMLLFYSVVFGDEVKVIMVVLDGINVVEFQFIFVEIGNFFMMFIVLNMFEVVIVGGYVEFIVLMSDLDRVDDDVVGQFILVFFGVLLNVEGLMIWNVFVN